MKGLRLDWLGLMLVAWSVLARALVMAEPFPGWDADPTRIVIAIVGIGPTGSLLLDAMAWLGTGLVLCSRRARATEPLVLLAMVSGVVILVRTMLFDRGDAEAIRIASSWSAGWAAIASILSVAHRPLVRSVVGAVLLASVMMLASKAFLQVFVEHPLMLDQFDSDRGGNLASQGFEPGTAQALIYERRLRQPDPTAWFGLSNVLATFAAMEFTAFLLLGLRTKDATRAVLLISSGICAFVLVLIGSKAGYGVALLGLIATGVSTVLPKRWASVALLLLLVVPTLGVIARGVSGLPEGERSLLFRWFYMQGAAQVTLDTMPAGTGPAGFQDAYMLAKPEMATEDVSSPHAILLDYLATLGLFALPLIAGVLWASWRVAQNACLRDRWSTSRRRLVTLRPVVVAMILAPVFLGVWLESGATTIEGALARLLGVVAWGGLALMLVHAGQPSRRALAIGGFVLLCHAQLDMALSLPGSAPIGLAMLGLGAAGKIGRFRFHPRWPVLVVTTVGLGLVSTMVPGLWRWESLLRLSSQRLGEVVERREAVHGTATSEEDLRQHEAQLRTAMEAGVTDLTEASAILPADARTASEAARLCIILSQSHLTDARTELAIEWLEQAVEILESSIAAKERSGIHAQLGSVVWAMAGVVERPESVILQLRERGVGHLTRAHELAPRSPRYPAMLAQTLSQWGESERAREWAGRALELDDATSLDPLSALPEATRRRLERLAGGS